MATTVLVAIDLTSASDDALREGELRTRRSYASLVVCHVMPFADGDPLLFPDARARATARAIGVRRKVEELLRGRLRRVLGETKRHELLVLQGDPAEQIVALAEARDASLIVVGQQAHRGFSRWLLGHVAERVVRLASCNVLVARAADRSGPVLAATDLTDATLPAVRAGIREATRAQAPLALFHSVEFASLGVLSALGALVAGVAPAPETLRTLRLAARMGLERALEVCRARGDLIVGTGHARTAVLREAERLQARLIVVAARHRLSLARLLLGSTAELVARDAPCSVLVVQRPDQRHPTLQGAPSDVFVAGEVDAR